MLYTYTSTAQTVNANGNVVFNINGIKNCSFIEHTAGTSTITLRYPGIYTISVNADVTSSTTGNVQLSLYNNNTAVSGAVATSTIDTAADISNLNFTTAIKVLPSCPAVCNKANLTVVNTGILASVSNVAVTINKV